MTRDPTWIKETIKMVAQGFTQDIAKQAREMAEIIPSEVTGREALILFADAIEATNRAILQDEGMEH